MTPVTADISTKTRPQYGISDYDPDYPGIKTIMDSTDQALWISIIAGGLEGMYRNHPEVVVGRNLAWYPLEVAPQKVVKVPDVMVIFGRPNVKRFSYRQWVEDDVPPKVVFEIWSKSNTDEELEEKRKWYEEYGADEFYAYNPETEELFGYRRIGDELFPIRQMNDHVSKVLGIRFEMKETLMIYGPDGRPFLTPVQILDERDAQETARKQAEKEAERQATLRAEAERLAKEAKDAAEREAQQRAALEEQIQRQKEWFAKVMRGEIRWEDLPDDLKLK